MIKLQLHIHMDCNGNIKEIYRFCNINRPTCDGCGFQKFCDRIGIVRFSENEVKTMHENMSKTHRNGCRDEF